MHVFRRYLPAAILLLAGNITDISAQVSELPFFDTLKELTEDAVTRPTPVSGTNNASFQPYGLQLTENDYNKFGAAYFKNYKFSSEKGLLISFEYMVYGGDAGSGQTGGDGLSFFLFDAAVSNPGIGAQGAGLGYAYNRTHNNQTTYRAVGLNGAYLGVGFDSYGNFKKLRYQGDSRVSGIPFDFDYVTGGKITVGGVEKALKEFDGSNEVTLRGAMHPDGFSTTVGMGKGYAGYPVLVTQRTSENVGFRLKSTGNYTWEKYDQLRNTNYFNIRGGEEFEKSTDDGYRKALVELFPNGDQGFFVSVMVQHENSMDTIVYKYEYTKSFSYRENARGASYMGGYGDNNNQDAIPNSSSDLVATLNVPAPSEFMIGFSAATGNSSMTNPQKDYHIIKNLTVRLPRAAVAVDDYKNDTCMGAKEIIFKPLVNDYAYDGPINVDQEPCPECIDASTFRFLDEDGNPYSDYFVAEQSGVGKWTYTYNSSTNEGTVKFEPLSTFTGLAAIQYNIKGGKVEPDPYADEAYRSSPATIGVNITTDVCTPVPTGKLRMISNKMVRSKAKL